MSAQCLPERWAELEPGEAAARVKVGIETDRGQWVAALIAAGYEVFAINPMSVARYRQRHSTSGAKSDAGDAHVLAEIVRLDRDRAVTDFLDFYIGELHWPAFNVADSAIVVGSGLLLLSLLRPKQQTAGA